MSKRRMSEQGAQLFIGAASFLVHLAAIKAEVYIRQVSCKALGMHSADGRICPLCFQRGRQ